MITKIVNTLFSNIETQSGKAKDISTGNYEAKLVTLGNTIIFEKRKYIISVPENVEIPQEGGTVTLPPASCILEHADGTQENYPITGPTTFTIGPNPGSDDRTGNITPAYEVNIPEYPGGVYQLYGTYKQKGIEVWYDNFQITMFAYANIEACGGSSMPTLRFSIVKHNADGSTEILDQDSLDAYLAVKTFTGDNVASNGLVTAEDLTNNIKPLTVVATPHVEISWHGLTSTSDCLAYQEANELQIFASIDRLEINPSGETMGRYANAVYTSRYEEEITNIANWSCTNITADFSNDDEVIFGPNEGLTALTGVITCTYKGVNDTINITQFPAVTYSELTITAFYYDKAPAIGGMIWPIVRFTQKVTYPDGTTRIINQDSHPEVESAVFYFEGYGDDGAVLVPDTECEITPERDICTVPLKLTWHGETVESSAVVTQEENKIEELKVTLSNTNIKAEGETVDVTAIASYTSTRSEDFWENATWECEGDITADFSVPKKITFAPSTSLVTITGNIKCTYKGTTVNTAITQSPAGLTYGDVTIVSFSYADILASGSTVVPVLAYKQEVYNPDGSRAADITSGLVVEYTSSYGGTLEDGKVSATSKGTTVSDRTLVDTVTVKVTGLGTGNYATKSKGVYQEANVMGDLRFITEGGNPVQKEGETINFYILTDYTAYPNVDVTQSSMVVKESGNINVVSIDTDNKTITFGKNTTADELTCVIKASYNGKSITKEFKQVANITEFSDIEIIEYSYSDAPANGNKIPKVLSYKQIATYPDGHIEIITSGATEVYSADGPFIETDGKVFGADLGTNITPRTKLGTAKVTLTLNGKTAKKTVDVYQQENKLEYYDNYNLTEFSYPTIPASVGSGSTVNPTIKYTADATYTSGSTLNVDTPEELEGLSFDSMDLPIEGVTLHPNTGAVTKTTDSTSDEEYVVMSVHFISISGLVGDADVKQEAKESDDIVSISLTSSAGTIPVLGGEYTVKVNVVRASGSTAPMTTEEWNKTNISVLGDSAPAIIVSESPANNTFRVKFYINVLLNEVSATFNASYKATPTSSSVEGRITLTQTCDKSGYGPLLISDIETLTEIIYYFNSAEITQHEFGFCQGISLGSSYYIPEYRNHIIFFGTDLKAQGLITKIVKFGLNYEVRKTADFSSHPFWGGTIPQTDIDSLKAGNIVFSTPDHYEP